MADKTHVSELLAEVFRRGGMKRSLKRAQAVLLWPQVAGQQLAKFTRARNLVDGVLFVDVPDSETAMHLTLQRKRFLDVFQGKFGAREVRDIRFQTGRQVEAEEPTTTERPAVNPDPHDMAHLTRALAELELPSELSQPALQAAHSMLVYRARRKAEGWSNCPTCDALTPETGLCSTCKRYAENPQVIGAAKLLVTSPRAATPALSEDQRAVAALLAQNELGSTLSELLPQVLGDPELRSQLEAAARCFLALRLDKAPADVGDADISLLPPRVARILGHLE